nr:immunoglobulin heavy chain junction region [Mus musculus]
CARDWDDYW